MGLSEKEMLKLLEGIDLSGEAKGAICKLILANNKKLEEDVPKIIAKKTNDYFRRKGMRL